MRFSTRFALALVIGLASTVASAAGVPAPYKVVKTVKAGGDGGFDYVYADVAGRKLYVPRSGPGGRVMVFDLDSLASLGEIAGVTNARGVAVDAKSGHGFASSKPVVMWDAKSLAKLKTIEVQGNPDGIRADPDGQRIYVYSHAAPFMTVIDAATGTVTGTVDLEGQPEQSVLDGKGRLFVDLEDKDQVAVVDTKRMVKIGAYGLDGRCGTPAGLAMDVKNHILFVACRNPQVMSMLDSQTGKMLAVLPIAAGVDGAVFNPATREVFASGRNGELTVIRELGRTRFEVAQTVKTPLNAKTLTLDSKTNRVLLIAADFEPVPASAPAPRPARGPMVPGSFSIVVVGR